MSTACHHVAHSSGTAGARQPEPRQERRSLRFVLCLLLAHELLRKRLLNGIAEVRMYSPLRRLGSDGNERFSQRLARSTGVGKQHMVA